jgi:hypothetical protein
MPVGQKLICKRESRIVADQSDSRVGYKQPPIATRFKPGQSGNPRGRKKQVRAFKSDVRLELDELITVREGGREIKITKQRALVKALVAAAIKGDMRATNALVSFCMKSFGDDEEIKPINPEKEDLDLLHEFVGRRLKKNTNRTEKLSFQSANNKG